MRPLNMSHSPLLIYLDHKVFEVFFIISTILFFLLNIYIMHIVIFGGNATSIQLAKQLSQEKHSVALVTSSELQTLEDSYDLEIIDTQRPLEEILSTYNTCPIDVVIASKENDAENLIICKVAQHLGLQSSICVLNNGYAKFHKVLFPSKAKGHFHTQIDTNQTIAEHLQRLLALPGCLDFIDIPSSQGQIICLEITHDSPLQTYSVAMLEAKLLYKATIKKVWHNNQYIDPSPQTSLQAKDRILLITHDPSVLIALEKIMMTHPNPFVFIAGSSNLAHYLMHLLPHTHIKILDRPSPALYQLAAQHPESTVLEGDINDTALLESEGIGDAYAFIAITKDDENNIVSALQAKKHGVPHVFALSKRPELIPIIESSPIDIAIAPNELINDAIFPYCHPSNITSAHKLAYGGGYIVNIQILTAWDTHTPHSLPLPDNTEILSILRNKKLLPPKDSLKLKATDHLILWTQDIDPIYRIVEKNSV